MIFQPNMISAFCGICKEVKYLSIRKVYLLSYEEIINDYCKLDKSEPKRIQICEDCLNKLLAMEEKPTNKSNREENLYD